MIRVTPVEKLSTECLPVQRINITPVQGGCATPTVRPPAILGEIALLAGTQQAALWARESSSEPGMEPLRTSG